MGVNDLKDLECWVEIRKMRRPYGVYVSGTRLGLVVPNSLSYIFNPIRTLRATRVLKKTCIDPAPFSLG